MFYNTIQLNLAEHLAENLQAQKQENFILTIFETLEDKWLTPWQVLDICKQNGKEFEITSVRRAITDLEKEGILYKSGKANFEGAKGKPNHAWKFNNGKLL